jgi:hypothetical protein
MHIYLRPYRAQARIINNANSGSSFKSLPQQLDALFTLILIEVLLPKMGPVKARGELLANPNETDKVNWARARERSLGEQR